MTMLETGNDAQSNLQGGAEVHATGFRSKSNFDQILSALEKFLTNPKLFFGTLGTTLILVLIYVGYQSLQQKKFTQASDAFYRARLTMDDEWKVIQTRLAPPAAAIKPAAKETQKETKDEVSRFIVLDVEKEFPKSLEQLTKVVKEFARTSVGFRAQAEIGQLYFRHQDFTKAKAAFEKALEIAKTSQDRAGAQLALGYTLENLGDNSGSLAFFQKSLSQKEDFLKGDQLLSIARVYLAIGKKDEAIKIYDQILSELKDTPYATTAENKKLGL
jgi:tetratricopeptide (TPR) repeat protein